MTQADKLFSEVREQFLKNGFINWEEVRFKLGDLVGEEIYDSKVGHQYKKIKEKYGHNKDIKILDYGCGGGQLVTYLRLIGYNNCYGVDVNDQSTNNRFLEKLGISEQVCFIYDSITLPFNDEFFDTVISKQVLEHVHNLGDYYKQTSRVLKKGGYAFFEFPHRLIPFDSHSRTWFIHYFPRFIRRYLYDVFTEKGYPYYEEILNFKTLSYHMKFARKYFSSYKNTTSERIRRVDFNSYEGNVQLRKVADKLISLKLIGGLFLKICTQIAIADIELRK
jgi:SAM-dependent methyltransferase